MMDVSDAPASEGVMLALLPTSTEWCKLELPHMTLVYAGTKDKLRPGDFNSLAKDAASLALLSRPFTLRVRSVDIFGGGEEEKVDVLRFQPTSELFAMRRFVEKWNRSQHPFNPHATIGPVGSAQDVPTFISFDRIYVGWGDESLTFLLR